MSLKSKINIPSAFENSNEQAKFTDSEKLA